MSGGEKPGEAEMSEKKGKERWEKRWERLGLRGERRLDDY